MKIESEVEKSVMGLIEDISNDPRLKVLIDMPKEIEAHRRAAWKLAGMLTGARALSITVEGGTDAAWENVIKSVQTLLDERESAQVPGLMYVPGAWRCAKCDFVLLQSNLDAATGAVTPRDKPGDTCPNCATPMERVTYKDAYTDAVKLFEDHIARERESASVVASTRVEPSVPVSELETLAVSLEKIVPHPAPGTLTDTGLSLAYAFAAASIRQLIERYAVKITESYPDRERSMDAASKITFETYREAHDFLKSQENPHAYCVMHVEEAKKYNLILWELGMQVEGDPVARVRTLVSTTQSAQIKASIELADRICEKYFIRWTDELPATKESARNRMLNALKSALEP